MSRKRPSDSRLRACVTIDGKKYWIQAYSPKELEEKKIKKRLEVEMALNKELLEGGGNKLVKDWAEEWLALDKAGKINERYYKDIQGQLNRCILPVIGNKKLKNVRQSDIQNVINGLSGYSKSYMDKVLLTVRSMMKKALLNHYITDATITEGITMPVSKTVQQRRAITDEEREVILNVAKTFDGGIFYIIMLYAGLRPGEVAALKWKHIDYKKKLIYVRDALKSNDKISDATDMHNGKTVNATRDVFLSKKLEKALKAQYEKEEPKPSLEDFVAHKRRSKNHHTKTSMRSMWESFRIAMHIYMGGETDRSIKSYTQNIKEDDGTGEKVVVDRKKVSYTVEIPINDRVAKDLVPYDLRHTFCTDLRKKGVPIEEAKDLMGHADISLTAKVYSHATTDSIDNARLLFDA